MRFDYDGVDWRFVADILDANSRRLSRTRNGVSDTSTARTRKRPLLLSGAALAKRSAANEARTQQYLFASRHEPAPADADGMLTLLLRVADSINDGLLPDPQQRLRAWPMRTDPPADGELAWPTKVPFEELPTALVRFAAEVHERWPEVAVDPVPLAAWAEWELNVGTLHPFYDGCGRISRTFGALLLMRGSWLLPAHSNWDDYARHARGGPDAFTAYLRDRIAVCAAQLRTPHLVEEDARP